MSAYVPGFLHDIFISYSHANNFDGWVSKFRHAFEGRLRERVPAQFAIFRDYETLQGNDDLTPTLLDAVRRAAIFIPIVSHCYLSSRWCQAECEAFIAANAARGVAGCIFPVRYDDVDPAEYQKFVGERIGYEFFAKSLDDKYADTLVPDSEAFKARMNILRIEVGEKLIELQRDVAVPNGPAVAAETRSSAPVVFLAEPAPGLAEAADRLTTFLKAYHYEVVRAGDHFYSNANFESAFANDLHRSLLFVQLLGRRFDPHPDESVQSWDRWQFLQAQAAGVPTLRWFNKYDKDGNEIDLNKLDADHRELVTQTGVWDCEAPRFRELIRGEIEKRFHDLRQQERLDGPQPLVVLRAERSDKRSVDDIGRMLSELKCDYIRVPDKDMWPLEDFAKDYAANGLIVVYGACSWKWVLNRLQELRKFLQSEFGKRWVCGLWRAPEDEDALSISVDGLVVLDPHTPQLLREYVTRLRARTDDGGAQA